MSSSAIKKTDVKSEDTNSTGRIQVSAARMRRFYVFAARRLFAAHPQMDKIHVTALGSAITSAIGIAHELVDMKVAKIADVQTFYQPLQVPEDEEAKITNPEHASTSGKSIARILIVLEREASWTPDESDVKRPGRRGELAQKE